MKNIILVAFLLALSLRSIAQVLCPPANISTDPSAPVNPEYLPDPAFENHFEWFASENGSLLIYELFEMSQYGNIQAMQHPYSLQNQSYQHLTLDVDIEDLDMYPEDGWELISVNLGKYPDGTLYSEHNPPSISCNSHIPYLLLYNRYRGILRLFCNYFTEDTYKTAKITVSFPEPDFGVQQITSGLLRLYSGVDVPLSEPTEITTVTSVVQFPNVATHWFYSDFRVAFDPCTCEFPTYLNFDISTVNVADLEMVSRTITANIELVNSNGDVNVDANFLPGLNYEGQPESRGMAIYYAIQQMVEDYNTEKMAVIQKNLLINQQNAEIQKKLAVVSVAKLILTTGLTYFSAGAASVAATIAEDAAKQAPKIKYSYASIFENVSEEDLTASIENTYMDAYQNFEFIAPELIDHLDADGKKYLKISKLLKQSSEYLGKGFDFLSTSLKKGIQQNVPAPKPPTGSLSETSYSGDITDASDIEGWTMFNPGTFKNKHLGESIEPCTYPVYDEILGLFATLRKPLFDKHTNDNFVFDIAQFGEPGGQFFFFNINTTQTIKVSASMDDISGLKYAFNPAVPIDFEDEDFSVKLALIVDGQYAPVSFINFDGELILGSGQNNPADLCFSSGMTIEPFHDDNQIEPNTPLHFETPFVPVDYFSDLIESIEFKFNETWFHDGGFNNSSDFIDLAALESVFNNFTVDYDLNLTYKLKVMITLPFSSDTEGNDNTTTQIFTYNLDESNFQISNFPFAGTTLDNPNFNGSLPLQENLLFNAKNWTSTDHALYGGPSSSIRPSAFGDITISGNQSKDSDITGVDMRAQNEIIVSGDATINAGFTLALSEFVEVIPVPQVDQNFITAYCNNLQSNNYHANSPRNAISGNGNYSHENYVKKSDAKIELSVYPNPTSSILTISLQNFDAVVQFDIFNAIGNELQGFSKTVDGSRNINLVTLSAEELPNGTYTIKASMADGTSITKQFVVLK